MYRLGVVLPLCHYASGALVLSPGTDASCSVLAPMPGVDGPSTTTFSSPPASEQGRTLKTKDTDSFFDLLLKFMALFRG